MDEPINKRAAARQAADMVWRAEMDRAERIGAERIGAERVRQRVLAIPDSKRYLHGVGDTTIEVIDAAAVAEAIEVDRS